MLQRGPFRQPRAREEPGQGPWQGGVRPAHPEGSQPGTRAREPSETGLGNLDSRPALFRAQGTDSLWELPHMLTASLWKEKL